MSSRKQYSQETLTRWMVSVSTRLGDAGYAVHRPVSGDYQTEPGVYVTIAHGGLLLEWNQGYPAVSDGGPDSNELRETLESWGLVLGQYPNPGSGWHSGRIFVVDFPNESPWVERK